DRPGDDERQRERVEEDGSEDTLAPHLLVEQDGESQPETEATGKEEDREEEGVDEPLSETGVEARREQLTVVGQPDRFELRVQGQRLGGVPPPVCRRGVRGATDEAVDEDRQQYQRRQQHQERRAAVVAASHGSLRKTGAVSCGTAPVLSFSSCLVGDAGPDGEFLCQPGRCSRVTTAQEHLDDGGELTHELAVWHGGVD